MKYEILKPELQNDPLERGYADMDDAAAAADLNSLSRQAGVEKVSGHEIFEAVAPADFTKLASAQKQLLYAIVGMDAILVDGDNTKAALLSMFGAGTDTRANLAALQKRIISRAEELGLTEIKPGHVQRARS